MTEIDLIPSDYRTRQWQRRWLKVAGGVLGSVVLLHAVAYAAIDARANRIESHIAALESKQRISTQQRMRLEELDSTKSNYEQQYKLLSGLRSGASAEQLFLTIERALESDDVWFVDWRFQRSGIVVEAADDAVNTGYFIVVPAEAGDNTDRPWQVRTHMTIRGRSRDHSALSGFVKALFAQPEVEDVHLGRTSMSRVGGHDIVDFDLAVVMSTNARTE